MIALLLRANALFTALELHVPASVTFPTGLRKLIKAHGGKFTECRGLSAKRFVTLPIDTVERFVVAEKVVSETMPTVVILRGLTDRFVDHFANADAALRCGYVSDHVPSSAVVQSYKGDATASMAAIVAMVELQCSGSAVNACAVAFTRVLLDRKADEQQAAQRRLKALHKAAPELAEALRQIVAMTAEGSSVNSVAVDALAKLEA